MGGALRQAVALESSAVALQELVGWHLRASRSRRQAEECRIRTLLSARRVTLLSATQKWLAANSSHLINMLLINAVGTWRLFAQASKTDRTLSMWNQEVFKLRLRQMGLVRDAVQSYLSQESEHVVLRFFMAWRKLRMEFRELRDLEDVEQLSWRCMRHSHPPRR